jgi:hypothetical protein
MERSATADMLRGIPADKVDRIKRYSKYRFKIWYADKGGSSEISTRRATKEVRADIDEALAELQAKMEALNG